MERKVKIAVRLRDRAGYHEALAELKAALEDATLDQVMRIFSFRFYIWELKSTICHPHPHDANYHYHGPNPIMLDRMGIYRMTMYSGFKADGADDHMVMCSKGLLDLAMMMGKQKKYSANYVHFIFESL